MQYSDLLNKLGTSTSKLGLVDDITKADFDRFCVVKELWSSILKADDTSWIDVYIEISESPDTIGYMKNFGSQLKNLRSKGVRDSDIAELLNISQYLALTDFISVIDNGEAARAAAILAEDAEVSDFGLFFCDKEGRPKNWVGYIHENMEESAPTGKKEGYVGDDI